ncbi:MAG: hypothetical protein EOP51_00385 [Sphingobacteriales bacterium]|nr:MAG: hypothetical protein EOP51_00385 [Sphingobacteriales bacterium]
MRIYILLVLLALTFASCQRNAPHVNSFYYWKLGHENDSDRLQRFNELKVEHLYVHYMDVDWSEGLKMPVPKATASIADDSSFTSRPITPVIFITNRVFERMTDAWCDTLAEKLSKKISLITYSFYKNRIERSKLDPNIPYNDDYAHVVDSYQRVKVQPVLDTLKEIQIDCDWTAKTKDKYFRFLKKFKQKYPHQQISVTVRLYPYKYPKAMGVPPVDRGVLMCYNLGGLQKAKTANSIFSTGELKQYLNAKKYPLPLDIALPIFGWYAWFSNNTFKGIIYEQPSLVDNAAFKREDGGNYRVKADTVVQYKYLREGDVLRMEYPEAKDIVNAAQLVTDKVPDYGKIIFYHWDNNLIHKYENTIKGVYNNY